MSETSRSRVTITLGRTGQVVKRGGSTLETSFTDSHAVAGSKRSIRERLGNNVDSSAQFNNKRHRSDGRAADAYDGLSKDDLRYKIMQKNIHKQGQNSQQSGGDLRNFLSRPAQSTTNTIATRDRIPEPKDTRLRYLESMDGKQHFTEARDGRHIPPPVTRYSSQHIPELRSEHAPDPRRQHIMEGRESVRSILEEKDVRHHLMQEQRAPNPVTRMESGINSHSHSPWTLDRLRRRSPDETLPTSRGVVAPKRDEVVQRSFAVRGYDDARTSTYMSKDPVEMSRPMASSHLVKMVPSVGQMKAVAPVASSPPLPGSLVQRSAYVVSDQVTVDSFLRSLGLEKFAVLFKAEEVDMYSLKRMNERDLKELGIPMGPRKKILLALQPRLKQQA
ncbi:hypothetical protein ABFS82_12G112200 [Erythranthe guttata]|uniref:SAM domain-containing protein n=1 Tax=Erythranthe guttata TaxID=4155 RepID=A0A022QT81_ERYGU|nr:PREDICTED: uncharacterized protein LOC105966557 [Erythranthe guttata]EYU29690.1 hypothetical protein MIMGU_mgv1a007955mg [Erythranthe guttata]|eukprot:XP_012846576.1 PREDICTED: uncharacterized protein LOC105966557 [Erythranthe guttata]